MSHLRQVEKLVRALQSPPRRRAGRSTKLTWLAGLALIAIGILCLSLSGAVARTGTWWQGTWQALGVGFLVGGIVDVLAISLMSQYSSAWQRRWDDEAKAILHSTSVESQSLSPELILRAALFLSLHGDDVNPGLYRELRLVAERLYSLPDRSFDESGRDDDRQANPSSA